MGLLRTRQGSTHSLLPRRGSERATIRVVSYGLHVTYTVWWGLLSLQRSSKVFKGDVDLVIKTLWPSG